MSFFGRVLWRRRQKAFLVLVAALTVSGMLVKVSMQVSDANELDEPRHIDVHEVLEIERVTKPSTMESTEVDCREEEYVFNGKCVSCHKQCLRGCLGAGDDSCFACRGPKDGNRCVNHCPSSRPFVGGTSGQWCVSRCSPGHAPDVNNQCKPKWEAKRSFMSKASSTHHQPALLKLENFNLAMPKENPVTFQPLDQLQDKKLLLPLLPFGPNNQYRGFRESIIAAMYLGRTLVLPPFFNHYSVSLPQHMPPSKRKFAERHIMSPWETFDVALLAGQVPVATWQQFSKACSGKVEVEYFCRVGDKNLDERRAYFYQATQLDPRSSQRVFMHEVLTDWLLANPQDLVKGAFSTNHRCAVLVYPYLTLAMTSEHFSLLHPLLLRPARVRQIASHVWQKYMERSKYLAVHYRFNAEWAHAWCNQTRGTVFNAKLVPAREREHCSILGKSNEQVVKKIRQIMETNSLNYIYMATTLNKNHDLIRLLRKEIHHITLAEDVQKIGDFTTNYELSLVEQEICHSASLFLASSKSSWSSNIADERFGLGKREQEHVLWLHKVV